MKRRMTWLFLTLVGIVIHLLTLLTVSAQPVESTLQEEAEEARRAIEEFLREQRVLFRQGEIQLELSTFYSMDTREELIPVQNLDGAKVLAKTTNRSVLPTLTVRYGLIENLELDLRFPFFGYAEQKTDIELGVGERTTDAQGLGDISGRLRYQLWREQGARPDVILELNGKSRTGDTPLLGTGHWNVGAGITLVKTLDPVVFFGSTGYTQTFEREGRDPGNEFFASMGMGFSLNDRVSFKVEVIGSHVGRTERDEEDLTNNSSSLEIINLQFAVTVLITRRLFIEPVVSIGLTDDAVDVIAGFNMPFQLK